MDSAAKLYLDRAQNELNGAFIFLKLSDEPKLQINVFGLKEDTYYSSVIAHSYYCIFYSAKAYLLTKGVKTEAPEEHKKTYAAFEKLVRKGVLDVELLTYYKNMLIKADTLLHIFEWEKGKRGRFTYKRLPQANREPAKESIDNAQTFLKHIYALTE